MTGARDQRLEARTTAEVLAKLDRAREATGESKTEFVESAVLERADRVLADRREFVLTAEERGAWEALNDRPARDLPGVRALFERPSPFGG